MYIKLQRNTYGQWVERIDPTTPSGRCLYEMPGVDTQDIRFVRAETISHPAPQHIYNDYLHHGDPAYQRPVVENHYRRPQPIVHHHHSYVEEDEYYIDPRTGRKRGLFKDYHTLSYSKETDDKFLGWKT